MFKRNLLALALLVGIGLFETVPAHAMACEMIYSGTGTNNPSKWFCVGEPSVSSANPVSYWTSPGMGMSWPNQASHNPVAWVVCEYSYFFGTRHVTWQTFYQGNPYPTDICYFQCTPETRA